MINTWQVKTWTAFDKLSVVWKPDLNNKIKRCFFQAAVVSILLYGYTTWMLTKFMEKKRVGNFTRTVRAILNMSWMQHPTKQHMYCYLPLITKTIQVTRSRHAVHCWKNKDNLLIDILLWTSSHGRARTRRPARTYKPQFSADTGCKLEDLPGEIDDRDRCRKRVREIRASSGTWWWHMYVCLCMGMCIYIYMPVSVYIYIYIYIY